MTCVPTLATTVLLASGSEKLNRSGATILATSFSLNCPALSTLTPPCLNTKGNPVLLIIQKGDDIDI